jgi:hypothetical protein
MAATPPPAWNPPPPAWNPPPPAARWGPGRVIALVIGIVLLLPALGLIAGGGVLLWADTAARNDDGYVFSDTDAFSSEGYALASERIDLVTGADWVPLSAALGTARAEVTAADPGTEIFMGIAPAADGTAYLRGVEHSVINDLGTTAIDEVTVPGGAPSGPPGEQDFWAAQASGPGTQRLDWEPAQGNWVFVIMNADGSAGVAVDARIGATVPALGGLAWGLLAGGLFLLAIGVVLIVLATHRRPAAPYGTGVPPAAGPPPYWTPPAPADRTTAADARTETPSSAPLPGSSTDRPPTT